MSGILLDLKLAPGVGTDEQIQRSQQYSPPIIETLTLVGNFFIVKPPRHIIYGFKNESFNRGYFINTYTAYTVVTLRELIQQFPGILENKVFSISYVEHTNDDGETLPRYSGIGEVIRFVDAMDEPGKRYFFYNDIEKNKLISLYGREAPIMQINFDPPDRPPIVPQKSIQNTNSLFNSLSSLAEISQESFTITAATGSIIGLITEEVETISDVGGLSGAGRDREITSTRISSTIASEAGLGDGVTSTTVTTSGY